MNQAGTVPATAARARACSEPAAGNGSNKAQPGDVDATIRGWPGTNDAQRGQLRHYGGQLRHDAGSGLGLESRWLDPRQPSSGKPVRLRLRKLNITLQQLKHQLISDRL